MFRSHCHSTPELTQCLSESSSSLRRKKNGGKRKKQTNNKDGSIVSVGIVEERGSAFVQSSSAIDTIDA